MQKDKEEEKKRLLQSKEFFLHCYRDAFDALVTGIKKLLKELEEKDALKQLAKAGPKQSCPEDVWLPSPNFDVLEQNSQHAWANQVDSHGRTLLHYCCGSKQELASLTARYLLDSNASLLISDAEGTFPVHYLARQGNVLMFERCPEFLRVVSQKTENALAQTPYDIAKSKGQTGFISFLLAKCPWIAAEVQIKEARRKQIARAEAHSNPSPLDSPKKSSRRPSSAGSSLCINPSPTGSKRNSIRSDDIRSDDSEGHGLDMELDDAFERSPAISSMDNLHDNAQEEQNDIDELYRITCEFSNWDPVMSKALVFRWLNIYVYNRGCCLDLILTPHCGNAAIHLAVTNGCTDAVIILLKMGASTDVQNDDGHTPLHLACIQGLASIVHELLKVGADVHRQDKDGCIPVELISNTSEGAQIIMIMFRYASTLSIDMEDRDQSLLESMIHKQHFEIVNLLLLMRPWSAFYINQKNETLLHCTAKAPYDSAAIVTCKVLVSLGIDANVKNSNDLTALEVCSELYTPMSYFLSDPLAIHIQRMQGIWHLAQLTELGYWNDQKLFEESSKKFSVQGGQSAKEMTLKGSYNAIKHLHKTDSDCNNLLHRACSIGAVALAQKLLNGGLAGLPQNLNGDTPLHVAAFNGHNDIILCMFAVSFTKALMQANNKHGFKAFHLAAFQGHIPVLETFLSWGYTESYDKFSPKSLFAAFAGKRWRVIAFLLEHLPHESKLCSDRDDNNFLHYIAALTSQDAVEFFKLLPVSKFHFLFERRCLKKKNVMNLDPFEMAGMNHNVTFLSVFRKYCACCIVCSSRQLIARRRLQELQRNTKYQVTGVWKVKGYPSAASKRFVLWSALGAIVEILDRAIFIRKIIPNSVAASMNITAGSSITALWDIKSLAYRIVRIVKQAHSDHFHLHGMLAIKINAAERSSHQMSHQGEEFDENTFCLQNGVFVRLLAHEFEEATDANIFGFAAVPKNQVVDPFSHQKLLKIEGPHMIIKLLSVAGDKSFAESHYLLKNVITREELQVHFHPDSDALSNLLFAPMKNIMRALERRPVLRKVPTGNFGEQMQQTLKEKASKEVTEVQNDASNSNFTAEDLYFGADDGDNFFAAKQMFRPDVELYETVEKLEVDAVLPCTVIAAVGKGCLSLGAARIQSGDQIIAIDTHRTMNLRTVQTYLEGKQGSTVTITVLRPLAHHEHAKVEIIRAKLVRTTCNPWLSWVESTILLQQKGEENSAIKEATTDKKLFAEAMINQQLISCEVVAERGSFELLSRIENLPVKRLNHRFGAYNGLFLTLTAAADRIKAVYRAHIIRRSVVCNFTIRQSLEEKSKSTERILMTNGLATQLVVEWVNDGLLGTSPLQSCIEHGHSEGLLQLIHYGFGSQTSWIEGVRRAKMFYTLMDSALENNAAKASLVLVQELGVLPILENSTYTQAEKALFVMNASIRYSSVDVIESLIENPSVMQCLGEHNVQKNLTMAIRFGRVRVVHAILQARPRMACLRLISFPDESALTMVLRNTNKSKHVESAPSPLCFDFAVVSMLFSFAKFGSVLFSQNNDLNPLATCLAPSLVESLHSFATCREAEVLKAIANGIAVRCRKRKEESMIRQLKLLHEKRQEESKKAFLARKQSSWAKIASTQEMVAISRNIRKMAIESNMERELGKEHVTAQSHLISHNLDRELSRSASQMRMAGMQVPKNQPK